MKQSFRERLKPVKVSFDTFTGWSDRGYMIIKGSKSHSKDANGIPLFSNDQVKPRPKNYSFRNYGADEDWDGLAYCMSEEDLLGHFPGDA